MKTLCFKKVQKCLTEKVWFFTCYKTKKLAMFCSAKDFIPTFQKSNVVHCLICAGCNKKYLGKTDPNFVTGNDNFLLLLLKTYRHKVWQSEILI